MLFQEQMLTLLLPLCHQMLVTAQIPVFEYMRKRAPENLRENGQSEREEVSTMTFKTLEVDEMFQLKEFDCSFLLYTVKNLNRKESQFDEKWSSPISKLTQNFNVHVLKQIKKS